MSLPFYCPTNHVDLFTFLATVSPERKQAMLKDWEQKAAATSAELRKEFPDSRVIVALAPSIKELSSGPIMLLYHCEDCPRNHLYGSRHEVISNVKVHLHSKNHKLKVTERKATDAVGELREVTIDKQYGISQEDADYIAWILKTLQKLFPESHFDGWVDGPLRSNANGHPLFVCYDCGEQQPWYSIEGVEHFFEHLCTPAHQAKAGVCDWSAHRAEYQFSTDNGSVTEGGLEKPAPADPLEQYDNLNHEIYMNNGCACGVPALEVFRRYRHSDYSLSDADEDDEVTPNRQTKRAMKDRWIERAKRTNRATYQH